MDFLKDDEDKSQSMKQLNYGAQIMMPSAPDKYIDPDRFQRYKTAKINIVCLVILDTFLSHNFQEINQDLLLPPLSLETSEEISTARYREQILKFGRKIKVHSPKMQDLINGMTSVN